MKSHLLSIARRAGAAALLSALLAGPAVAAPGAHGPDGEHLDAPVRQAGGTSVPRLEASSELFELVATLRGGELSILIDWFETNEPVLGGAVEVDAGAAKAVATFHADHGTYAVDDPAVLQALRQPGEHALVFTIAAGGQMDLLDGTLKVADLRAGDDHDHGTPLFTGRRALLAGGFLVLAGSVAAVVLRRRRAEGGLQ